MTESMRAWIEIVFNISYLIVIWTYVVVMWQRRDRIQPEIYSFAPLFIWAFALLALGDTGHVGFRVWARAVDNLETTISLFGQEVLLIGLGTLSTAVTVTVFYALILLIWQRRFDKPLGWFGILLLAAAVLRLIVMAFPQNEWNSMHTPWTWSMYRNIPLIVQGLGAAFLILRDAAAAKDSAFQWIGIMILISYGFYIPVILFAQTMPLLGMLMIPKTIAYVAIAHIGFANWFSRAAIRSLATKK